MHPDFIKGNTSLGLYRSFIAVYETRSVRRASEVTGVSHSAISQNMKSLSEQLGVRLFHPLARGVEPSSEAIRLYPDIRLALDIISSGEKNIREFGHDTYALVRLFAPSTLASYVLIEHFKEFRKLYPYVAFEFAGKNSIELLEQRRVDFVVDLDHTFKGSEFTVLEFLSEECVFIASSNFLKENNLSTDITKEELTKLPIVAHQEVLRNVNHESDDLKLNAFVETATSEVVFSMVKNGLGLGIYYKSAFNVLSKVNKDVVEVKVENIKVPPMKHVIAYNDITLSKAARTFVELISSPLRKS